MRMIEDSLDHKVCTWRGKEHAFHNQLTLYATKGLFQLGQVCPSTNGLVLTKVNVEMHSPVLCVTGPGASQLC